ncbi:hypothetical protein L596_029957 [Steinernema carpocapsae]|uniref:Uncharacterized protein n=1 Tax=Steinernema carpocapsae TaxID=34508 RepID=A0A4U5LRC0_STECR|nr:hypothetical protein L596_029957 [Steinernema carpocapsae]
MASFGHEPWYALLQRRGNSYLPRLPKCPKPKTKIAHAGIQLIAIVINVFGLKAAWDSHDLAKPPIPNLMSCTPGSESLRWSSSVRSSSLGLSAS